MLVGIQAFILIIIYRANAQIIERSHSPALPRWTQYKLHKDISHSNKAKTFKGIEIFTSLSCFSFVFTNYSVPIGFMVYDDNPNLCTFNRMDGNPPITLDVGGCSGPGEIAALFFAISGLQPHDTRPDRDSRVSVLEGSATPKEPLSQPKYNTYGHYDLYSIMHPKAHTEEYTLIPKRHPKADPRRFPSAVQFEILAKRAMGQRVFPSPTDFMQLNSELCDPNCKKHYRDCGASGYVNGRLSCLTCMCPGKIRSLACSARALSDTYTDITLSHMEKRTIYINVNADHQPIFYIHTKKKECACPGYTPAVRFRFKSKKTELLMRDGSCQDYISITTDDREALPEEIRMCGPIVNPINDFYIATNKHIFLTMVKDEWMQLRAPQNIPVTLDAVCLNLDTGKYLPMVDWRYIFCRNNTSMTTTITTTMTKATLAFLPGVFLNGDEQANATPSSSASTISLTVAWLVTTLHFTEKL